ncbi:MAG TPA: aldehyde dehydrogenase family protein [Myxococcota bacterium]|nr:aldehyde dehydrogenase family protein [Myxococcota bacterium]
MAILERIESDGPRRRLRASSPATLEPIGEFDCATADEVHTAVERARKAQADWGALPVGERGRYLLRWLDVFLARQDEVIDCVIRETGKPRAEAIGMEVYAPCDALAYYAKRAERFLRPERRRVHGPMGLAKKLTLVWEPLGVVALVTPWNGPVALAMVPTVQALAAGNAVVHKPSEVTPFSALVVKSIFDEAGMPADLYQVVQGDGETGAALVGADVDKVSFTGSVETGRRVAEACAQRLVPCTLELGGKDAMIVCADADLDRAAEGAVLGSCMNTGHYCCGTERIYVEEAVHDAFVEKVVARTRALRQGVEGAGQDDVDVGAVFWDRQMEIIERHVDDARARGARVLVGGRRNPDLPGLFYEPTVIVDLDPGMEILRDETFGPIVAIVKVRDADEALRLANDSRYGLNGNVWTRDPERGFRLARALDTGGVCINDMALTYGLPEAPFGGRKDSGVGRVNGGADGLRGYCHAKPISADRRGKGAIQGGYPYTRKASDGMQKFIRLVFGTRLGRWLG